MSVEELADRRCLKMMEEEVVVEIKEEEGEDSRETEEWKSQIRKRLGGRG